MICKHCGTREARKGAPRTNLCQECEAIKPMLCRRCGQREAEDTSTKTCRECTLELHPDFYKRSKELNATLDTIARQAWK